MMKTHTILISILFFFNSGFSQLITLRVIDEISGNPISNCHLSSENDLMGISDERGIITLINATSSRKVKLTHISYAEHVMRLSFFTNDTIAVRLKPVNILLPEYSVVERKRNERFVKMGITDKRAIPNHPGFPVKGIFAQYIENEKPENCYIIEGIYVFIKENDDPMTQFLVSIYAGESVDMEPNPKLRLFGPILCQTGMSGSHFKISVDSEKIIMPQNGLYIVFEGSPDVNFESENARNRTKVFHSGMVRVGYSTQKENQYLTWHLRNGSWERLIAPKKNERGVFNIVNNPMVYVKLRKKER